MVPLFLSYLNMLLWFQTFAFNYKLEGHELANSDWFSEHIFRLKKRFGPMGEFGPMDLGL